MKSIKSIFANYLAAGPTKGVCMDSEDRFTAHAKVLASKPMLQRAMKTIHLKMLSFGPNTKNVHGKKIELGAGVSPLKDHDPSVLSSDIYASEHNDLVLDASDLDLDAASVAAIFCQNSFHHFPNPQIFFEQCERTLCTGGRVIILDPYYGRLSSFIFKNLFKSEDFDKAGNRNQVVCGPMSNANQALSYVVFVRDRKKFEKLNPNLKIVFEAPSGSHLTYLLSGGLNFIQLVPDWLCGTVFFIERALQPLNKYIAIHHFVVLEKIR